MSIKVCDLLLVKVVSMTVVIVTVVIMTVVIVTVVIVTVVIVTVVIVTVVIVTLVIVTVVIVTVVRVTVVIVKVFSKNYFYILTTEENFEGQRFAILAMFITVIALGYFFCTVFYYGEEDKKIKNFFVFFLTK